MSNFVKMVGIVYSPSYGAGWSTWGSNEMALDQELAIAIEAEEPYEVLQEIAEKNWPNEYLGGLADCVVEWVPEGTCFRIEEYDGYESLHFNSDDHWTVAR